VHYVTRQEAIKWWTDIGVTRLLVYYPAARASCSCCSKQ